mgnify:CR=1 FL=1
MPLWLILLDKFKRGKVIPMYMAYDLKIDETFFKDIGFNKTKITQNSPTIYRRRIARILNQNIVNGTDIQKVCFNEIDADVFISHSHNDKELAIALARWLECKFRIKSFIDSDVWDYVDNLLKTINDKYSDKQYSSTGEVCSYNYNSCNRASQHANIMLITALQKMIDKTECIIFLNTDNSIQIFNEDYGEISRTYSPWIYSEILSTQIIRKKPLFYYRDYKQPEQRAAFESAEFINYFTFYYDVCLDHLTKINGEKLNSWVINYYGSDNREKYPLDALYSFTNQKDIDYAKHLSSVVTKEEMQTLKMAIDGNPIAQERFPEILNRIRIYNEENICKCDVCQGSKCKFRR